MSVMIYNHYLKWEGGEVLTPEIYFLVGEALILGVYPTEKRRGKKTVEHDLYLCFACCGKRERTYNFFFEGGWRLEYSITKLYKKVKKHIIKRWGGSIINPQSLHEGFFFFFERWKNPPPPLRFFCLY